MRTKERKRRSAHLKLLGLLLLLGSSEEGKGEKKRIKVSFGLKGKTEKGCHVGDQRDEPKSRRTRPARPRSRRILGSASMK